MKKTKLFPRRDILERQRQAAEQLLPLELDLETLKLVRGGDALYGLPKTRDCEATS